MLIARRSASAGFSGYREIGLLLRGFSGFPFDSIDFRYLDDRN